MRPDKYITRNPAHPTTALAAWMSMAKLGRNSTAKKAGVAINTMSSAMRGGVRLATAELIAKVVRIDSEIISKGDVKGSWVFRLTTDGAVEVLP